MRERLDEPMSLEDMAKIAYISPFHFDRIFRQITGIPPLRFLYALRLQTAKQLLLTTDRSVTDVCFEVGYNSLGTFTTRFTQLVGLSPCRFRRFGDHFPINTFTSSPVDDSATFSKHSVCGHISSPSHSAQIIFVGLFRTFIPQGVPIAGTLLASPGPYQIGPVPEGSYVAMAAAFPTASDPIAYLLPESHSLLVGVSRSPVTMSDGKMRGSLDITLRPMRTTDPPILIALPYLLESRLV
jgi:AraC-like DNA-binding protein